MDHNDRQAIEELFGKLEEVERHVGPRDPDAEALIQEKIGRQVGAPYYMAQTIVAQEHALIAAQRRIEELEGQGNAPSGRFLGAIFGGGQQTPRQSYRTVPGHEPAPVAQGSGFLAGAAQTAVGVAGGVFLASMIAGAFAGGAAQAAEPHGETGDDGIGGGDGPDNGDGFDVGGFDFGGDF